MRELIETGSTVEEAVESACRQLGLSRLEVRVEILEMPVQKLFKKVPAKVRVSVDDDVPAALTATKPPVKPAPAQPARPVVIPQPAVCPMPDTAQRARPVGAPKQPPAQKDTVKSILESGEPPEVEIVLADDPSAADAVAYLNEIFTALGAQNTEIHAFRQGEATLFRANGEELASLIEIRGETIQALSYLVDRAINKSADKREGAYLRVRLDIAGYRDRRETELLALAKRTAAEVLQSKRSRTLAPMNSYERLIIHTAIGEVDGLVSESIGSDVERRVVVRSTATGATDGGDWRAPQRGASAGRGRRPETNRSSKPRQPSRNGGAPRQDRGERPERRKSIGTAPEREYANRPKNTGEPIVPTRREAIQEADDLPLYGKIEL